MRYIIVNKKLWFTEFILQEFKIWSATNLGQNFRGTSLLPPPKKGSILLKSPFGWSLYDYVLS